MPSESNHFTLPLSITFLLIFLPLECLTKCCNVKNSPKSQVSHSTVVRKCRTKTPPSYFSKKLGILHNVSVILCLVWHFPLQQLVFDIYKQWERTAAFKRLNGYNHSLVLLAGGGEIQPFQKKQFGKCWKGPQEVCSPTLGSKRGQKSIPIMLLKKGLFVNKEFNLLEYHK